ncbi:BZ3500_MvSof-1268-A1-R1_Chr7-1g09139 [Microbotryum saponariae]|uniref:BZ3500_MvSof-1268-A1-R1_Chr7-1g09139 protein n=1 Tax=Microbotryum saponariae TaxID=289078 RepID=A0A2X0NCV0_9BASI|nr:BZ3501_MvSof-1269-A2-R1_Chr7-1g08844 [Microbotryum saponariae]SDA02877.1 BZ3500_MvSof-1268-A1-R1_Chr7-1g09139 [Microbotryum saponariae]
MLATYAGLPFWFEPARKSIHLGEKNGWVRAITFVAAWINENISTVVAVLMLLRALSGSQTATMRVKTWAP